MLNRSIKAVAATGLLTFTSSVFADQDSHGFYTWADVTDVTPLVSTRYEEVPVESCRIVTTRVRHDHPRDGQRYVQAYRQDRSDQHRQQNALPALFGGLIGGAIGNQFGSGNGKKAMTLIGAIAGASIASNQKRASDRYVTYDDHEPRHERDRPRHQKQEYRKQRVCETQYEVRQYEEVDGYQVTYSYLGQEFEQVTENHPGDRLKLYVTIDAQRNDLI